MATIMIVEESGPDNEHSLRRTLDMIEMAEPSNGDVIKLTDNEERSFVVTDKVPSKSKTGEPIIIIFVKHARPKTQETSLDSTKSS